MLRIGNNTICAAIIALACFLPEVGLFVDGDILFHLERYTEAKQEYSLAFNMCPSRFRPLEGLMNIYEVLGDGVRTKEIARKILLKPVKVPSRDVDRIKKKAETVVSDYSE